jgi:hypothetical protein
MFDSLNMLEPVEKWDCPKSLEVNLLAAFGEYMIRHKLTLQFCFLWIQNSLCNTKDCLFLAWHFLETPAEVRTLKCSCVSSMIGANRALKSQLLHGVQCARLAAN